MIKKLKLKNLLETFDKDKKYQKFNPEQKKMILDMVKKYNQYGDHLKRVKPLDEVSHEISEIIKYAEHLMLSEAGDWFDEQTVKKNAKELKKLSDDFSKIASEASILENRMIAAYDEAAFLLSRYFSLNKDEITEINR